MKSKLILTGQNDCMEFFKAATQVKGEVVLQTSDGKYSVNGKSIMGCLLAASEWAGDIWLITDGDNYFTFEPWIEVAANDGVFVHE